MVGVINGKSSTIFKGVVIRDPSKQCTAARGDACSDIPSCMLSFGAKVPYPRALDPESLPRDRFVSSNTGCLQLHTGNTTYLDCSRRFSRRRVVTMEDRSIFFRN